MFPKRSLLCAERAQNVAKIFVPLLYTQHCAQTLPPLPCPERHSPPPAPSLSARQWLLTSDPDPGAARLREAMAELTEWAVTAGQPFKKRFMSAVGRRGVALLSPPPARRVAASRRRTASCREGLVLNREPTDSPPRPAAPAPSHPCIRIAQLPRRYPKRKPARKASRTR